MCELLGGVGFYSNVQIIYWGNKFMFFRSWGGGTSSLPLSCRLIIYSVHSAPSVLLFSWRGRCFAPGCIQSRDVSCFLLQLPRHDTSWTVSFLKLGVTLVLHPPVRLVPTVTSSSCGRLRGKSGEKDGQSFIFFLEPCLS